MASNLKVFVCEFITGGGLYSEPLPSSLVREGQAMLDASLSDLLDLPGIELTTTRDPRLPPLELPVKTQLASSAGGVWALWQRCIDEADVVWAVAPESDGVLEKIATLAQSKWLGSKPSTLRIAASKRATALHLARHDIPVVPTWLPAELQAGMPSGVSVAKPDDGVGCEGIRIFDDGKTLRAWLENGRLDSHVVQPWLPGEAASISMLCNNGVSQLLSCNRQLMEIANGSIRYRGSLLNAMAMHWAAFEAIAVKIAAAMPGLAGYVGVDVMVHEGRLTVLEINPRLTTSYVGLRRAIAVNPAELVLDLHYNGRFIEPGRLERNVVEVSVND